MNRRTSKIVGLFLVLAAVSLIAQEFNLFDFEPGIMRLFITAVLAFVAISNISPLNFYGILIPVALAFNLNAAYFNIHANPWLIFWASLLLAAGLSLIFKKKTVIIRHSENESINTYNEEFTVKANFKSSKTNISGHNIRLGNIESNFSNLEIYIDPSSLNEQEVNLYLEVNFSGVTLMVPRDTKIINQTTAILANVNEPHFSEFHHNPVITLYGDVNFSRLDIIYI
ncbi:MAG TPA: hypothetical protein VIG45_06495 [Erysipelothrix sp.]